VNAGDVVVEFDATMQQRTLEQRRSEFKQAESEVEKAEAEGRRRVQAAEAELAQLKWARDRAKLDLQGAGLASRVEVEKLQLAVSDAEQHVVQLEQKIEGERRAAAADVAIARQKRDKAGYDVAETERTIASLTVKAPSAGQISLMPNIRAGGPMQRGPEFKRGDRAWFGAPIADLPDLSSIRMGCRVDEADRARLQVDAPHGSVCVDAIPDREFDGRITDISLVARPDFTTFPPVRNFDVVVSLAETDPRVKSGMSAPRPVSSSIASTASWWCPRLRCSCATAPRSSTRCRAAGLNLAR
jgi:multidrug resistance efflux pump